MVSDKDLFKAKILIVDDDPYIVQLLGIFLKGAGFARTHGVTDPRQAMDSYMEFQPDLVVLDLVMPYVDGFTILKKIKEQEKEYSNVLILTARTDRDTRLTALGAGAREFLTKPFDRDEALARIKNLIKARLRYDRLKKQNLELARMVEKLQSPQKKTKVSASKQSSKPPRRDGRFVLLPGKIVLDEKLGLEWLAGPDNNTTWEQARRWVGSLDVDGGGWRMPTIKHLRTLYRQGRGKRNLTPLLQTTGWRIWSGTTKGPKDAWRMNFSTGDSSWIDRHGSKGYRAFAVRSRK